MRSRALDSDATNIRREASRTTLPSSDVAPQTATFVGFVGLAAAPLALDHLHLCLVVGIALRRGEVVELLDLPGGQRDAIGVDVLLDAGDTLGARDRCDVVTLSQQPRDRHLRRGSGADVGSDRRVLVGDHQNPKLAHSQAIGGMVGGIGMALLEATQLDHRDGRIVNANMSDYLVPVNADVPALDATFLPAEDTIVDPLGVKGLGELVMVGVPAAITNAVFNATGKRVTDLSITLDKLL